MRASLSRVFLLCAGIVLLPGRIVLAQAGMPSVDVFDQVGIDQNLNGEIPLDISFRDERGKEVLLGEYFTDKPVVLSLVYYNCPMLCTQVLNGMVETFRVIEFTPGEEFEVVTVSIDPAESETLATEKKDLYMEAYGKPRAAAGWHFLTGSQASIKALAEALGFRYVYDEKTKQFAHASGIMIATPKGRIARYLYGIEYPARDLTFSLMEAAENRIGSAVNKLLLLCYHYDPATGRYGVIITNILRAGGILCVVLIGAYVVVNVRRERRVRREAVA
jgi:protein SCO1/2